MKPETVKHTPQLVTLEVDSCAACRLKHEAEYRIPGIGQGYHGQFADKDQASRIVATWNACEGIPTEDLAPGSVAKLAEAATDALEKLDRPHSYCGCTYCCLRSALVPFGAVIAKADPKKGAKNG